MDQSLDELILGLTTGEGWEAFKRVLDSESGNSLKTELDAESIEDIKYQRGYRAGLAFAYNMRELVKLYREHDAEV